MYGMCCVVYTTGLWLLLASYLELPVSTTHSTVGGIVGMAMAYGGADCVVWSEKKDEFPYVGGIASIVASWVLSPLFSGIIALVLFVTVRHVVLRSPHALSRAFLTYPLLVTATIAVNGEPGWIVGSFVWHLNTLPPSPLEPLLDFPFVSREKTSPRGFRGMEQTPQACCGAGDSSSG